MTYKQVKTAAELRSGGDSTGAWALADALLAEVPNEGSGARNDLSPSSDIATRLSTIAVQLEADGIDTPSGNPYSVQTLRELRLVAMGWPPEQRFPEAAFRTHQEAGTVSEWKREVLRVLCLAARNADWEQPPMNSGEMSADAWNASIVGIQRKVASGTRFPVAANDLRLALQNKVNVPPKDIDEANATVLDAVEELRNTSDTFDRALRIVSRRGIQDSDVRVAFLALIQHFRASLDFIESAVTGGGITDASLERFLSREAES